MTAAPYWRDATGALTDSAPLVLVAGLAIFASGVLPYKVYVLHTGSMSPTIAPKKRRFSPIRRRSSGRTGLGPWPRSGGRWANRSALPPPQSRRDFPAAGGTAALWRLAPWIHL